MNERIKELAIQAGFFYEDYKDIWYLEYHNQTCEEELKKFSELIVRECLICCERTISDPVRKEIDTFEQGGIHCMDEITHNFGLK
jgi:hypothetical protein